jgi:hypothetical protein
VPALLGLLKRVLLLLLVAVLVNLLVQALVHVDVLGVLVYKDWGARVNCPS